METTRHKKITRPTTAAQIHRLPESAPLSQVESTSPWETGPQLGQATQLGHQLGQVAVTNASGPTVQAKLTVGAADDTCEMEADRVAGQVMRMVKPEDEEAFQRMAEPQGGGGRVQRAGGAASFDAGRAVEQRIRDSRGQGSALPAEARAFMEPRFGRDFSQVTVHADAQADQLNRQLSARAFTTGRDIYFRQGAYAPGSPAGQKLLAHELTHVVQQGAAGGRIQRENGDDDDDGGSPTTTKSPADPVASLKAQIEAQRAEIYAIRRENQRLLNSEADDLELVLRKLIALSAQLDPDNYKAHMKAFKTWREGEGYTPWQTFVTYRDARAAAQKDREDHEAREAAEAAARRAAAVVTWSAECDAVFADMNNQYQQWDGTKTNRGAWWGAAQPGSKAGARRVPDSVIAELRRRVHGTAWRFSDSWSGGISFHRTYKDVDFIYHMLPP